MRIGRRRIAIAGVAAAAALATTGCIRWDAPATSALTPSVTGFHVDQVLVGDFDGDGLQDLVSSSGWGGSAPAPFVLWSNGDGTFERQDLGLPAGRPDAVGDFDGDGADDVVFGMDASATNVPKSLYFGGPASEGRPRGFAVDDLLALEPARSYDSGDFDGDGVVDLLRVENQYVYYEFAVAWLNDGAANFTPSSYSGFSAYGSHTQLRRDGRDVVIGNMAPDYSPVNPYPGVVGRVVAHGDIDADGSDDLAVTSGGQLVFYRWNGTSFVLFPAYQELPVTGSARVQLLDLDGDDVVDVSIRDDSGVRQLSGTADGGFPYEAGGDLPAGPSIFADVDGDGLVDAVEVTSSSITVHRNTSDQ
jgi:hypothetical protein